MRHIWSDLQPHLRRLEAEAAPNANTDSTHGQSNCVRPLTPQKAQGDGVQLASREEVELLRDWARREMLRIMPTNGRVM